MLARINRVLTPRRTNVLIGAGALVWLLALSLDRGLWTEVTAAWVQALGSIAAIGASTMVAVNLARSERTAAVTDARQFALTAAFDVVKYFAFLVATLEEPEAATPGNLAAAFERIAFADTTLSAACTPQLGSSQAIAALYALRHHTHLALSQSRNGFPLDRVALTHVAAQVAESYDLAAQAVGARACAFANLVALNRRTIRQRLAA